MLGLSKKTQSGFLLEQLFCQRLGIIYMNSLLSVDVNRARLQQIYFPSVIIKEETANFSSCWKKTRALGKRSPAQRLFWSYFCIPPVQSPSSHTALVIRRNGHTLLRVMTGNHSCILGIISPEAAHSQTVASGFGHRGASDSQGENLQQTCCEQIRRRKYSQCDEKAAVSIHRAAWK